MKKPKTKEEEKLKKNKIEKKKEIPIIKIENKEDKNNQKIIQEEELEEINGESLLENWNISNSSPSLKPLNSPSSLENVVGNSPIKIEKEKLDEIKYSLGNDYNGKKDDYSFNSGSYISPSGQTDLLDLGKDRQEFKQENVKFDRNSGDFFGVKESREDYKIKAGEKFDETKRKSIFEMEKEKFGEVKSNRDYR